MMSKKEKQESAPDPLKLSDGIDAHTHLDGIVTAHTGVDPISADDPRIPEIIDHANKVGIRQLVTVGDDLQSSIFVSDATKRFENVYGAVAIHPTKANQLSIQTQEQLHKLALETKIVAIGETGLDWYWIDKQTKCATKEEQINSFNWHIDLAKKVEKPIMIHNRDADNEILAELTNPPEKVIFHCFSSDINMAKKCIDQGFYLSLSGTVTFKNSQKLQEAAKIIPNELLLTETDAPYLTPHPHRGKINEPYCLPYTIRFLAQLRSQDPEELAEITAMNARRVYGLA